MMRREALAELCRFDVGHVSNLVLQHEAGLRLQAAVAGNLHHFWQLPSHAGRQQIQRAAFLDDEIKAEAFRGIQDGCLLVLVVQIVRSMWRCGHENHAKTMRRRWRWRLRLPDASNHCQAHIWSQGKMLPIQRQQLPRRIQEGTRLFRGIQLAHRHLEDHRRTACLQRARQVSRAALQPSGHLRSQRQQTRRVILFGQRQMLLRPLAQPLHRGVIQTNVLRHRTRWAAQFEKITFERERGMGEIHGSLS